MLKYFNKLPKGKVAEPLPVLAQQATVAEKRNKVVGRPPSTTNNNKSKIGELNSLSSTTSNNAKELVVVAEKILIERLQKDCVEPLLLLLRNINCLRKLCSLVMVRM